MIDLQSANPDHTQECIDRRHGHRPVYNTETDKRHPAMVFSIEQRKLQLNCEFMRLMCDSISERRATASTDFGSKRIKRAKHRKPERGKALWASGKHDRAMAPANRYPAQRPSLADIRLEIPCKALGAHHEMTHPSIGRPRHTKELCPKPATHAFISASRYPILKSHRPDCLDGNTCHRTDDLVEVWTWPLPRSLAQAPQDRRPENGTPPTLPRTAVLLCVGPVGLTRK